MRTNHEKYKEKFEEVASRSPNKEYILEKLKILT